MNTEQLQLINAEYEVPQEKILPEISKIFIDWSGVISDDRDPVWIANSLMLRHYGIDPVTFDEWLRRTKMDAVAGMREYGVEAPEGEILDLYHSFLATVKYEGVGPLVYPDAHPTLQKLAELGLSPYVVSTHPQHELEKETAHYGVSSFLSGVSGGLKSKSQEIQRVCELEGIHPSRALLVGDMITDMQHGLRAGVYPIGVTTGYHTKERLEEAGAHLVIPSFSQVLQVIGHQSSVA